MSNSPIIDVVPNSLTLFFFHARNKTIFSRNSSSILFEFCFEEISFYTRLSITTLMSKNVIVQTLLEILQWNLALCLFAIYF